MSARPEIPERKRLYAYSAGFFTNRWVRRILSLAGYDLRLGRPRAEDGVAVWGQSPFAWRGERMAQSRGARLVRIEDAFLRSLFPGRRGEPPLGLMIDQGGVHFDPETPSDLETLLATHSLDDPILLTRARQAIARLKRLHLTKYSAVDPVLPLPAPGYVLVVDQTRDDASVRASGATEATFQNMLAAALADHPDRPILIKTHPETTAGFRGGYYGNAHASDRVQLISGAYSPWALLWGAHAVYTVSSQLGFESILAGHRPHLFGQPFYAGWGLSHDQSPLPRRGRQLSAAQLFAAAMILFPTWYDPYQDRLCALEQVIDTLEAESRAWREDHTGWQLAEISVWKRKHMQAFFGQHQLVSFGKKPNARKMVWASRSATYPAKDGWVRVEDGFLRSKGLGADLIPPLSLVLDDLGIYYDAGQKSRLEALIAASVELPEDARTRSAMLIEALRATKLSKYNIGDQNVPTLSKTHTILVPGQVEDDASILCGTDKVRTNLDLLRAARAAHPEAQMLYKPHPDVEAGLRPGAVPSEALQDLADHVLSHTDPIAAIHMADEIWTMTSLLGFEALLHGKEVTCLGVPFYAGWGLTKDMGKIPTRRCARPDLTALVHATLIDYPRYHDPVTNRPCPPEVVIDRLQEGIGIKIGKTNRLLAKAQGLLAPYTTFWRRQ